MTKIFNHTKMKEGKDWPKKQFTHWNSSAQNNFVPHMGKKLRARFLLLRMVEREKNGEEMLLSEKMWNLCGGRRGPGSRWLGRHPPAKSRQIINEDGDDENGVTSPWWWYLVIFVPCVSLSSYNMIHFTLHFLWHYFEHFLWDVTFWGTFKKTIFGTLKGKYFYPTFDSTNIGTLDRKSLLLALFLALFWVKTLFKVHFKEHSWDFGT